MPDYGGPGGFQGGGGNPGGFGGSGRPKPGGGNRPNMLDIAGPVSTPAASSTPSTPATGGGGQSPVIADIASDPTLAAYLQNIINPPPLTDLAAYGLSGGEEDQVMSEALASATPDFEDDSGNNLVAAVNNAIANSVGGIYKSLPATLFGLDRFFAGSTLGNIFNFNPSVDEETGEVSTSLLGPVGTATMGKLNIDNYKDYRGLMNPQDFYSAAFVDPATGELYDNTNFEALKTYTDNMGAVLKPGKDLEQNLKDRMEEERRQTRGPSEVYQTPSLQTISQTPIQAQPAGGQLPEGADLQAIYNNLSPAEQDTVDTMMGFDEGYDLAYALRYVLGGNPLF